MTTGTTTVNLNLRQGPGTEFPVLALLPPQTPLDVLGGQSPQGDWLNVRAQGLEGWVHHSFVLLDTQGVPEGLLNTHPVVIGPLKSVSLAPSASQKIVLGAQPSGIDRQVANAWNKYGGLLGFLSDKLRIDPGAAVAVLAIESGGRGFAADGRMIIRFENHLFFDQWGKQNEAVYRQHFSFNPDKRWLDHRWRPSESEDWREFHGSQDGEWEVFGFARTLNDTAAKLSISMGGPQIVGFNYPTLGFESVQQMFDAFSADERSQIQGFFDFVQGPSSTSRRALALQARDFTTFAALYNGPGQAAKYGSLMQGLFDAFQRLKPA